MFRPKVEEVLFAYIVVASHAVSLVLVRVDSNVQRPIYYASKSLHKAEVRYVPLEKAILAVMHVTCKLPPLLLITHSCCPDLTSVHISTSER